MTTTMAVSATPPVLSPSSGTSNSAGLFCTEPLYTSTTSPTQSLSPTPRLSSGLLSAFLPGSAATLGSMVNGIAPLGGGGGGTHGGLKSAVTSECRMVEIHGIKVASFHVDGRDLICLPQVFDLFLKHLVGGLHTVYTKLKRLDICPVVCTVEQVRVLRGLGAIQPGVNRCKLISKEDFEALYNDCTNASSRPGRPPKLCSGGGVQENPRLHPGLLSPALLTHSGLTAAAMAELQKFQKLKMMMKLHQNGNDSDNDDMQSNTGGSECSWDKERLVTPPSGGMTGGSSCSQISSLQQQQQLLANRLDLPFMMMPHPLLPVGLPPASVAMAMSQMSHLNTIANMAAAQINTHRVPVTKDRVCDSLSPSPSVDSDTHTPLLPSSQPSTSSSSPQRLAGSCAGYVTTTPKEKEDTSLAKPVVKPAFDRLPFGQVLPPGFPAPFLFADGISSVEAILTNIQGLLKLAVENSRVQDENTQEERRRLKQELSRERDLRESLQRQLSTELHSRASIQKRLKREKRAKRKLQEALQFQSKRRERVEDALKHSSSSSPSPDPHATDAALPMDQSEIKNNQQDNHTECHAFLDTPVMFQ